MYDLPCCKNSTDEKAYMRHTVEFIQSLHGKISISHIRARVQDTHEFVENNGKALVRKATKHLKDQ